MSTAEMNLGREALVSLAAKLTMSLFGFVGVVVFAFELGPDGVGRYYFALAVALALVRMPAGVGNAVKKRVSEVQTDPGEYLAAGLLFHAVYLVGVVFLLAGLYAVREAVNLRPDLLLGVFAVVATVGLFQILNRFYQGIGYPGRSLWIDTVRSVLTLAAQLALLSYGGFGLLVGLAAGTVVCAVLVVALARVRPRLPSRETLGRVKSFATWSVPSSMIEDFYKRFDVLLLGYFVGPSAVAFYETALRLVTPATQLAASISTPLSVKASGLSSVGAAVRADISNAFTYTGLFAVPIFFGALAMPSALMRTFFSNSFADGGVALVGVALFSVFVVYKIPLADSVEGTNYPHLSFRVKLGGLLFHLPLAVVLAERYGLVGVIGATLAAEVAMLLAYEYLSAKLFDGVVFPRPVLAQVVSGLVMYGVVAELTTVVSLQSRPVVVGVVVAGAVVYFLTLVATSAHFRLTVRNVLGPAFQYLKSVSG